MILVISEELIGFMLVLVGGLKQINFSKESPINQIDMNFDFNYDSDTDGNSNPIRIDQKYEIIFKNTSKFMVGFVTQTSGKNTTITRKNPDFPFVKINRKKKYNFRF